MIGDNLEANDETNLRFTDPPNGHIKTTYLCIGGTSEGTNEDFWTEMKEKDEILGLSHVL